MLRNYLAAALRNLVRNRLYAAINIVGLSVGFAAALLIALFVRDEVSYDKWIPGHERAYIVTFIATMSGRAPIAASSVPLEYAAWMKTDYPSIQYAARLRRGNMSLRRGEMETYEKMYWADPDFFRIIPLPVIAGDLETALNQSDGIVLTRKIARKYFGRDDPIGEIVDVGRANKMKVTAVLEDLPSNTHLDFDVLGSGLASFSGLTEVGGNAYPNCSFCFGYITYFKLSAAGNIRDIQEDMPRFFRRHQAKMAEYDDTIGGAHTFPLVALADIHLAPSADGGMRPRGEITTIQSVSVVSFLIVAIAGVNFVNLMTARAGRRRVEVGIRKVSGAARRALVTQFLSESLIYVAFAAIAAIGTISLLVDPFGAFLQREFSFRLLGDIGLIAGVFATVIVVTLLAGAYPAFVLSAFHPAAVLKVGTVRSSGTSYLRPILVMLQFAALVGLTTTTLVIYRQTSFAFNEGMRLDTDQVLSVFTSCRTAFRDEVARLPGVRASACSGTQALDLGARNQSAERPDGTLVNIAIGHADFDFFSVLGIAPIAGRNFDRSRGIDRAPADISAPFRASLIINQAAARQLGFGSPEAAIGQTIKVGMRKESEQSEIIGVVPDFSTDSIRKPVVPTVYFVDPSEYQVLTIKLSGKNIPETLSEIDRLWRATGDPGPITRQFLNDRIQSQYMDITRQSQVFSVFAGVAIFIASLGLLGLASFIAEQRTKEIGIRKAMGATRRDILRLLLWQFTKPVLMANVIAWPVAYFVMRRWLEGFAYHIDLAPWMFLAASALAVAIAVATVLGHALLVARAQPAAALRYE